MNLIFNTFEKNKSMISKKCKYAIKALLYLSDHERDGKPIFSSEIAEQERIPKKFLETILWKQQKNILKN